jgi:prephenate dehydratase
MQQGAKLTVGTLGGPATFAGEATSHMRALYPDFGEVRYLPSMDDCWTALDEGSVDLVVLGTERTGQPHHGQAVVHHRFYVVGESIQPLRCNLYGKPGSTRADIRFITGHGSIHQCTRYLDREFPGVRREMHRLNSEEAARAVLAGDGSVAVVGTESLTGVVPGLQLLANGIEDAGALCVWWVVRKTPVFSDTPDALVVTARYGADGKLGALIGAVQSTGYALATAAAFAVNAGVSVYDYLLTFRGQGTRETVEQALAAHPDARLAGAYER